MLGHCVKIPPRILKLIFFPDTAKPFSLMIKMSSLRSFGKPPLRGFILIFTRGPKESNKKELHEAQKMTILGNCVGIQARILKFIFTPDPVTPASLRLKKYSLRRFRKRPSSEFIPIFTLDPKDPKRKVLHEPLKTTF